jgi:hypothetical protein
MILHVRSMSPLAQGFPTPPSSPHPRLHSLLSTKLWNRRPNKINSSAISTVKALGTLACVRMCHPSRSALSSPRRIRLHELAIRRAAKDLAKYRSLLSALPYRLRQTAFEESCRKTVVLLEEHRGREDVTSGMQTEDFEEVNPTLPKLKTVYLRPSLLPACKRKRSLNRY